MTVVSMEASLSEVFEVRDSLDFIRTNDDLTFLQEVEPDFLMVKLRDVASEEDILTHIENVLID